MSLALFLQIPPSATAASLLWVCLPVILGAIALYLLLPQPRRTQPLLGGAFAGAALVLGGWVLIHTGAVAVEAILFYAFSAIAVVAGGLLVTQRNPIRAALSFAMVVLSTCGLFLLQAAPFLMAATIIIYAGAIVVTFLFVIMLAQQIGISDADQRSREPFLSCVAGFVLLGSILCMLQQTYDTDRFDRLLAQADLAARESSVDGMARILGDNNRFFNAIRAESRNAHVGPARAKEFDDAVGAAENDWNSRSRDVAKMAKDLKDLQAKGVPLRDSFGNPDPPAYSTFVIGGPEGGRARLELSKYSRLHSTSTDPLRDSNRQGVLPANNVEYLGRTLFTDYLLAVELGGTLLLIATIGAIAIAGRRPEGLR
jgi:NADH-quinone oxidoreductase subunit J